MALRNKAKDRDKDKDKDKDALDYSLEDSEPDDFDPFDDETENDASGKCPKICLLCGTPNYEGENFCWRCHSFIGKNDHLETRASRIKKLGKMFANLASINDFDEAIAGLRLAVHLLKERDMQEDKEADNG